MCHLNLSWFQTRTAQISNHGTNQLHRVWHMKLMHNSVTWPILRRMMGYIDDEQLQYKCHLMTLGVQVRLLISWHGYVMRCMPMLHNNLQVD